MNRSTQTLYGLIGYPLSHSFSAKFFNRKFMKEGLRNFEYQLFEMTTLAHFREWLSQQPNLRGLNVTIPHKTAIIPYLSRISAEATGAGAVNTISIESGTLIGHNTDIIGFDATLRSFAPVVEWEGQSALVLGSGGAARAVSYVLRRLNMQPILISRSISRGDFTYEDLHCLRLDPFPLIVNTTPLGTSPNVLSAPDIPYHQLTPDHYCYDLVYNPEKTLFLQRAEAQGCFIKNGLDMLHLQAEASWKIWQERSL